MKVKSYRLIALTSAILLVTGLGFVKPIKAQSNLFSVLGQFFKKPAAIQTIKLNPIMTQFSPSQADLTRWNERIKLRDEWREKLLADGITGSRIKDLESGLDPTNPDIAYDPTNNRYLVVFEKEMPAGTFNIIGQFYDTNGSTVGSEVTISTTQSQPTLFLWQFSRG
jgi:hypothetical protein